MPNHNEIEVLVRLPQEQVFPQLIDFRAELFMTGVLQEKLIEDFKAHLFWRGIQSLDYRCISLLWQIDNTGEGQVEKVCRRESRFHTRQDKVLSAAEIIEGSLRLKSCAHLLGKSLLHSMIKSNYNTRDQAT